MPRQRTGCVTWNRQRKCWVARLDWVDDIGKRHCRKKVVENKSEGKDLCKRWIQELETHGEAIIDGERLTFTRLAHVYEERKLTAPFYKGETKVSGLRSHHILKVYLRDLVEHFGSMRVRYLTHSDIEEYKLKRLTTKTRRGSERAVASVNRELQLLRAMLNFAKRSGWIVRNPFESGESLISIAQENRRDRVLSREEESRLLAACQGNRAHLGPILICALDTGMRRGEILQLRWMDVDLAEGIINVRKSTTKTQQARTIGMTKRLKAELQRLRALTPDDPESLIFGISVCFKNSFASACQEAGIVEFRFHDCRHTATTRLAQSGLSPLEVMRITGHSQLSTLTRYFNQTPEQVKKAAAALDNFNDITLEIESRQYIN